MRIVLPSPPIRAPGFQIVTGTFRHEAAQTLDIAVEGESKPIGTTPNHPIWSVDREAFVRADSLSIGEQLQTLKGIARVTSISPRGPPEPVYNLEVQVKHTYYVADTGVLVHNGAPCSKVYRGLAEGENPANGLFARSPHKRTNIRSHVAGKKDSSWISTTKSKEIALKKFGKNGVVEIDLSKVNNTIVDLSNGIRGTRGRLSNYAKADLEVLIRNFIPPEAIKLITN